MDRIITDNSKVNENLLNEVNAVNKQNKELIVKNIDLQEQLLIQRVSQQSELLAFRKWQKDNWKDVYLYSDEFMISEFKKANCG